MNFPCESVAVRANGVSTIPDFGEDGTGKRMTVAFEIGDPLALTTLPEASAGAAEYSGTDDQSCSIAETDGSDDAVAGELCVTIAIRPAQRMSTEARSLNLRTVESDLRLLRDH